MRPSYRQARWSICVSICVSICIPTMLVGCRGRPAPANVVVEPLPTAPESPQVAWTQGPEASTNVPPGELAGLVVDAATGEPLTFGQVYLDPLPATRVVTDSSGRFRLPLPDTPTRVRVGRIGFRTESATLHPKSDSGYAVVFALRPVAVVLCRVFAGGYVPLQAVQVRIRDAMSGDAPIVPVAVTVRDGAFRDSIPARVDSHGRLVANAAPDRPGRYDVTVRAPGYRDWFGQAATRPVPGCTSDLEPAVFQVWLIRR